MDLVGGLAQALGGPDDSEEEDEFNVDDYGLRLVQLKRALRGAAFARGALFSLRPAISFEQYDELQRMLRHLEHDVFEEIGRLRSR